MQCWGAGYRVSGGLAWESVDFLCFLGCSNIPDPIFAHRGQTSLQCASALRIDVLDCHYPEPLRLPAFMLAGHLCFLQPPEPVRSLLCHISCSLNDSVHIKISLTSSHWPEGQVSAFLFLLQPVVTRPAHCNNTGLPAVLQAGPGWLICS